VAFVDDRIWCHPKFTDLSADAFATWVRALAYSSGMGTKGHLSPAQQKLVGGLPRVRAELVRASLWDENGSGIVIHDWDEYNGQRDARREADRERKRRARESGT
jgi:hypothetical protein